jgi:hypothetical protein
LGPVLPEDWRLLPRSALADLGIAQVRDGDEPILILPLTRTLDFGGGEQVALGRSDLLFGLCDYLLAVDGLVDGVALYESCWGLPFREPSSRNALHVAINRLRKRLDGAPVQVHRVGAAYGIRPRHGVFRHIGPAKTPRPPIPPLTLCLGREQAVGRVVEDLSRGVVWIHGPLGMGKSCVARAAVETSQRIVVWADCSAAGTTGEMLAAVAVALKAPDAQVRTVRGRLASLGSVLLVLDGADAVRWDDVDQIVGQLRPDQTVVTAQHRPVGSGPRFVSLTGLKPSAGAALAKEAAGGIGFALAPGQAQDIHKLCGGHPGLIQLLATRLDVVPWGQLSAYLSMAASGGLGPAYGRLFPTLDDTQREVLHQLSLFEGAFQLNWAERILHAGDCWPLEVVLALQLRGWLEGVAPGVLRVPAPLRLVLRGQGSPNDQVVDRYLSFCAATIESAVASGLDDDDMRVVQAWELRRDFLHACSLARERSGRAIRRRLVVGAHQSALRGGSLESVAVFVEEVAAWTDVQDLWAGMALHALGSIMRRRMDPAAVETLRAAEAILRVADSRGAIWLGTIGVLASSLVRSQPEDAAAMLRPALARSMELCRYARAAHLGNLLTLACGNAGDPDGASEAFQTSLRANVRGADPWVEAGGRVNYAVLCLNLGSHDEALRQVDAATHVLKRVRDSFDVLTMRAQCWWIRGILSGADVGAALAQAVERAEVGNRLFAQLLGARLVWLLLFRGERTAAQAWVDRLRPFDGASLMGAAAYLAWRDGRNTDADMWLGQLSNVPLGERWQAELRAHFEGQSVRCEGRMDRVEWRWLRGELAVPT